ncbi:glycosyltransferase family 61 protein [Frigoribacterium sp. UYMn621]|uniref:glycosyltransferase family 61 protein n=1 Tax=Frigoribacterium sp. UYMn621 TaxID=3156343 RepID=UPI00339AD08C
MIRFARGGSKYAAFETAVVAAIHLYWLDNDEKHLRRSADLLRHLDKRVRSRHTASDVQLVTIEGWLLSKNGYRIRMTHLRKLNPGYRIKIERYVRVEFRRSRNLPPAGFRVTALGPRSLPPFDFSIADAYGDSHLLPLSNSDALYQARFFPHLIDDGPLDLFEYSHGYIDSIVQSSLGIDDNPSTWLSTLAHLFPAEMLELVESRFARFLAPIVAELLTLFPSQARWSDRFALAAHGADGAFHSDYTPMRVDAVAESSRVIVKHSIPIPLLRKVGAVHRAVPGERMLPVPDTRWIRLRDARVQSGGTVLADNALVLYEEAADPRRDFVAGQWDSVYGSPTHPEAALVELKPSSVESIDEGILLSGRNDSNWFHWMIEYLPRVMQIDPSIDSTVPLLVTNRTPVNGLAALRSLTARPVLVIDPEVAQLVNTLHLVAPPVQILDTTRTPWREGLSLNPAPLRAMRAAWALDNSSPQTPSRRIFLSRRSGHRGLINEQHLADIAVELGFETHEPGSMSFEEQLQVFSHASLLVGASGAVMANYLMMSPGSTIIALTSDALTDFILPAAIAAVAGVHFSYLSGPPVRPLAESGTRNNWLHSDFTVDPNTFRSVLGRALEEPDSIDSQPTLAGKQRDGGQRTRHLGAFRAHSPWSRTRR